MSLDFFSPACQEPAKENDIFGLCDDAEGKKAYSDVSNPEKWIATVKNEYRIPVVFTAIDKCIVKDDQLQGSARCDGMLTFSESLYFVELENKPKRWKEHAIEQLESTIKLFTLQHDLSNYKHKKAFACNKKHPSFQVVEDVTMKKFYSKYKVRIDVRAEIVIK